MSTASPNGSVPSITTTVSAPDPTTSSPISRALSKARKKRSSQNLSISEPANQSSLSLSSTENSSLKSTTKYIEKIRRRRAERRERKEAEHAAAAHQSPRSRRNSVSGSFESEASNEHETEHDGISITFEPGLVAPDPAAKSLVSAPTFPISISTSFEDPSLSSRSTQLQVTSDGRPIRRSTSPAHSSRESSPSPNNGNGPSTPTLASGIVLGNILAMNNRKKRSDSTTSNSSGVDDIPRSVPLLQPKTTPSTALSTEAAVTLTKPDTVVTPPTPIDPTPPANSAAPIISRRARGTSISKLPSKLAHSSLPEEGAGAAGIVPGTAGASALAGYKPLTPTIEVPTPQPTPTVGTNATPNATASTNNNNGSGFFSNMFSAAQTAASQLSSTIANTSLAPGAKGTKKAEPGLINNTNLSSNNGSGIIENSSSRPSTPGKGEDKDRKPLAVETLGQGELSLGSLGITTGDNSARERKRKSRPNSTSGLEMPEPAVLHGLGLTGEKEEEIGTIPKSAGGILGDKSFETVIYEKGSVTNTPAQAQVQDEDITLGRQRSDSGRSILGRHGSRKRRERGVSAATQGSDSLTSTPMLTGRTATFAPANIKRNREFHQLFKSVPLDDNLIEDYGCALQKEILLQGRMYVSSGHICFYSNIFGWTTTLVISFDEIVAIERKMTALVIPNAIMIQTLHARNVFASFISRDSTYDLILGIWRTIHPNLVDTINGTRLGDKEAGDVSAMEEEDDDDGSEYGSDDEYDSLGDESDVEISVTETPIVPKSVSKKTSTPAVGGVASPIANGTAEAGAAEGNFPGPPTHAPTACGDEASHLDRALCDETISVPLGKVFQVMYGENSYPFLTRLLAEDCKVEQLSIPNEAKFADSPDYPGKKARSFNYIKPLNASIGPKSTKCLITEVIEQEDMEKAVTVVTYTQTPDVPSGGVFKVLTRTCLMWGDGGSTRIVMNCTVEWSGKSWIKGPIEKGASEGQIGYTKDLLNALRREFAPKKASLPAGRGGKKKRRASRDAGSAPAAASARPAAVSAASAAQKWGILAPVMEPVTSLLGEFGAGILVTLMVVMLSMSLSRAIWGEPPSTRGLRKSEREMLAEMWMREEAGLWEWLEDRAGINDVLGWDERVNRRYEREGKAMREKMKMDTRMVERQVDEAIRVTEERLGVLKKVHGERKGCQCGKGGVCNCQGGCKCSKQEGGCSCGKDGGVCKCAEGGKNCGCAKGEGLKKQELKREVGGCRCGENGGTCRCSEGGKNCGCGNNSASLGEKAGGCGCGKKVGDAGCGCKSGGVCACKDCKCGGGGLKVNPLEGKTEL